MPDDRDRVRRLKESPRTDVPMAQRVRRYVEALQSKLCGALERTDTRAQFRNDVWERPGGGGGITRILEDGTVFEKAGVNTSAVHGELPRRMAEALGVRPGAFFATGISLVVHPRSPFVPSFHANFRYFALGDDLVSPEDQWFGGGADLTPYYPFLEDVKTFHIVWKELCDNHAVADYDELKRKCDEYFFLPHRGESRGVGGIFFDYFRNHPEDDFYFIRDAGRSLLNSYLPIVERRRNMPYGPRESEFHEIRRGRYVEFNLVYDRGTKFGLETDGRAESILMSLPPRVVWKYDWLPEPGSPEAGAARYFVPRDWFSPTIERDLMQAGIRDAGEY